MRVDPPPSHCFPVAVRGSCRRTFLAKPREGCRSTTPPSSRPAPAGARRGCRDPTVRFRAAGSGCTGILPAWSFAAPHAAPRRSSPSRCSGMGRRRAPRPPGPPIPGPLTPRPKMTMRSRTFFVSSGLTSFHAIDLQHACVRVCAGAGMWGVRWHARTHPWPAAAGQLEVHPPPPPPLPLPQQLVIQPARAASAARLAHHQDGTLMRKARCRRWGKLTASTAPALLMKRKPSERRSPMCMSPRSTIL